MQLYDSNEYRASKQWPYAISSGCVVFRKNDGHLEILLLVREAGDFPELKDGDIDSYHLPKGHVDIGETLEQTAVRETKEEAGCEVEIKTYLGAKLFEHIHFAITQSKIIHYFAGEWLRDLATIDDEHSHKKWYQVSEAITLTQDNPKREDLIIKRVQNYLELIDAA